MTIFTPCNVNIYNHANLGCVHCQIIMCMNLTPNSQQKIMEVNYLGSVYPTRAVITTMKERRMGRIMFVSSQAGQLGLFGYTAYSPSKFALRGLAESLQMEVSSIPFSPNMVSNFRAFV